jgi:hypothetical protein
MPSNAWKKVSRIEIFPQMLPFDRRLGINYLTE